MNRDYEFFDISEFGCPSVKGSGKYMKDSFIIQLESARRISGVPYVIVSGFRFPVHNKSVGGVLDSSHLFGLAADIGFKTEEQKLRILYGLIKAGFMRIIIHKTFIHVDSDMRKGAFFDVV